MKAIICGGREYALTIGDAKWLDDQRALYSITEVCSGKATGADAGGEKWAKARGIHVTPFPAKWDDITAPGAVVKTGRSGKRYNALAGFWRNQEMAERADICIVFPGGTGTADMVNRAEARGLKIVRRTMPLITTLLPHQIFVFGSNEAGIHGGGAALFARAKFGAEYGKGLGRTGQCFAIPTKDRLIRTLPLGVISAYVDQFLRYADSHPELEFLLTPIGCGRAGYTPKDIAPMFAGAPGNVKLPPEFVGP